MIPNIHFTIMLLHMQSVKCFYFSLIYVMLIHILIKYTARTTNNFFWDRNVLVESARIARGKIQDLKDLKVQDFDAVIFPGGFGAAKNL